MKKLSLQWRLTLMTGVLLAAACLILNFFVSRSAILQMNEIEDSVIEISISEESPLTFDVSMGELYPEFRAQLDESQKLFRIQSIGSTLLVIVVGCAAMYCAAGKALAPLRVFSEQIEQIQEKNLSSRLNTENQEREISRLAHAFNEMLGRLEQAFAVKRRYSASAAHELRTPLAVMQTKMEVFRKKQCPEAEEYEELITSLQEQSGRLSRLVKMLLEMTELQTVERNDLISLHALAEEVICDLAQKAEEKQVQVIQLEGDVQLVGSDPLLYRAVYNLIENAVKYNRPGGSVSVRAERRPKEAVLTVADTGMGISPEDQKKIFEPFYRVDKSRSRAAGGFGLGLTMVADIARLHGGTVVVERSSEKGTQIRLSLPIT